MTPSRMPQVALKASTEAYSLRAAERSASVAYALALDRGETPRESFAAALSAWQKFRPYDPDACENVVLVVLAALGLDETDRHLLPA